MSHLDLESLDIYSVLGLNVYACADLLSIARACCFVRSREEQIRPAGACPALDCGYLAHSLDLGYHKTEVDIAVSDSTLAGATSWSLNDR